MKKQLNSNQEKKFRSRKSSSPRSESEKIISLCERYLLTNLGIWSRTKRLRIREGDRAAAASSSSALESKWQGKEKAAPRIHGSEMTITVVYIAQSLRAPYYFSGIQKNCASDFNPIYNYDLFLSSGTQTIFDCFNDHSAPSRCPYPFSPIFLILFVFLTIS